MGYFSVIKLTNKEDTEEKIDIIISGFKKKFGIQIKTGEKYWNIHKEKYPDIPSMLLNEKTNIEQVWSEINEITDHTEKHHNLFKVLC